MARLTSPHCISATKKYFCVLAILAAALGLITFFVYLGYGVNKKVYQNEYAVVRNKFSTKLKGPLVQGTYNDLTIGDSMYKYTSTIQFIEFGPPNKYVSCITNDGLLVNLEINIQLQYNREEIIPVVWYEFNDDKLFMDFVRKTIYGLLYEDCALFPANDYYSTRNVIENTMYDSVLKGFNNKTSGVTIYNVQLKNIMFPQAFTDIIASKQHLVQEIQTQYNNRTTQLINANSTLIQAVQQAQIIIIQATNQANILINNANATAYATYVKYDKIGNYFSNIKSKLGFNSTNLIKYIYSQYIKSGSVYAGV